MMNYRAAPAADRNDLTDHLVPIRDLPLFMCYACCPNHPINIGATVGPY